MPLSQLVGADFKQWQRVRELQADDTWKDWQRAWELQADGSFKEIFSTGGLYFLDDSTDAARFYDLQGSRQSDGDISLGAGRWRTCVNTKNGFYFAAEITSSTSIETAVFYTHEGVRDATKDIRLGAQRWFGGFSIEDYVYFIYSPAANQPHTARAWNVDTRARTASRDISLGTYSFLPDGAATADRIYAIVNFSADNARWIYSLTHAGIVQITERIPLTHQQTYLGLALVRDGIYAVNNSSRVAEFYSLPSRARDRTRDITLGTGSWTNAMAA